MLQEDVVDRSTKSTNQQSLGLRSHQAAILSIVAAIATRQKNVQDILAAVTPGGGKSLLPVLAAARLISSGVVDRVCWIVPRDSLRLQAEEAFQDPRWRNLLGHTLEVRSADNSPNPCRDGHGYVTTYQALAAAPDLHLAEFRTKRYLICVDELHHLPATSELDRGEAVMNEDAAWSSAIAPLLENASIRLLMSGTLERADGKPILWLPYLRNQGTPAEKKWRQIDFSAPGWAVVGYSRRQAIAERAIIPVRFGALDGLAEWKPKGNSSAPTPEEPVPLSTSPDLARYALYTAFRTEFAQALLRRCFDDCRQHRAIRRSEMSEEQAKTRRGLGKMLVVASDQTVARQYTEILRGWVPPRERYNAVRLAVSDMRDAQEAVASFRLTPNPSILVSVAMAYEGLDCPEVTHIACLTHIRSRPWLEQMIARATRVDPHGGPWAQQRAVVYHPDDIMFRQFRHRIETEQGTRAKVRRPNQPDLFDEDIPEDDDLDRSWGLGIIPLRSEDTDFRIDTVRPGPDFAYARAGRVEPTVTQAEIQIPPSMRERDLRSKVGAAVAAQVVEDTGNGVADASYHAYNAILKRVLGYGARGSWSEAQMQAALSWLERNRLSEHAKLLDGDAKYRWTDMRSRRFRLRHGTGEGMERMHRATSQGGRGKQAAP